MESEKVESYTSKNQRRSGCGIGGPVINAFQEREEVFKKARQKGAIETWLSRIAVFGVLVLAEEGPSGFFLDWEEEAEECEA